VFTPSCYIKPRALPWRLKGICRAGCWHTGASLLWTTMPRGDVKLFQLSALLPVLELLCFLLEFVILSEELYCPFLLSLVVSYKLVKLWLLWILCMGNYKEPCLGFVFEFALFCCVFQCLGLGISCIAFVGYRNVETEAAWKEVGACG